MNRHVMHRNGRVQLNIGWEDNEQLDGGDENEFRGAEIIEQRDENNGQSDEYSDDEDENNNVADRNFEHEDADDERESDDEEEDEDDDEEDEDDVEVIREIAENRRRLENILFDNDAIQRDIRRILFGRSDALNRRCG